MPELPEVETIRRKLRDGVPGKTTTDEPTGVREDSPARYHVGGRENGPEKANPSLVGKRIQHADLLWEGTLAEPTPDEFHLRIMGQTIIDFGRRAKYLLIQLSEDTLVVHLRMSGDLLVEKELDPVAPHHRVLLYFDDGYRLAFNDTRKFGRIWLLDDPASLLEKLGPEPLDGLLTPEDFYTRLKDRRRQLKPLLLDQSFIAGVGNIYADEALHRARLHPQTQAASLTPEQAAAAARKRSTRTAGRDRSQWREHRLGLPRWRFPESISSLSAGRRTLLPVRNPHPTHRCRTARYAFLPPMSIQVGA